MLTEKMQRLAGIIPDLNEARSKLSDGAPERPIHDLADSVAKQFNKLSSDVQMKNVRSKSTQRGMWSEIKRKGSKKSEITIVYDPVNETSNGTVDFRTHLGNTIPSQLRNEYFLKIVAKKKTKSGHWEFNDPTIIKQVVNFLAKKTIPKV